MKNFSPKLFFNFSSRKLLFLSTFGPHSSSILSFLNQNKLPAPISFSEYPDKIENSKKSINEKNFLLKTPENKEAKNFGETNAKISPPSNLNLNSSAENFIKVLELYVKYSVFHKDLRGLVLFAGKNEFLDRLGWEDCLQVLEAMRISGMYNEKILKKIEKIVTPHFFSLAPSQIANILFNFAYFCYSGLRDEIIQLGFRREYLGEMAFYCSVFYEEMFPKTEELKKKIEEELKFMGNNPLNAQFTRRISHFLQTYILQTGNGNDLLSLLPDRKLFLKISPFQKKFGLILAREFQKYMSEAKIFEANQKTELKTDIQGKGELKNNGLSHEKFMRKTFLIEEEKKLGVYHVDFLINSKYIVEINGPSHYLSTFPRRVNGYEKRRSDNLKKMGYEIFEVIIDEIKGKNGMESVCQQITKKIEKHQI